MNAVRLSYSQMALELNKSLERFEALRRTDPDEAEKTAKESLIRSGVLNPDGNPKEQIVNGDFFGWQ